MAQSSFLGQELPKGTKLNSGPDDRFLYDSPLKAPIWRQEEQTVSDPLREAKDAPIGQSH